ncbi:hypothetical protein CUR86_00305 [Salinicola acroporae]|uniref:ATPase AAA-type core domain-containing protein n=1 Tax=Salinicola acroporae TaxID=1541440 RepID=A0ABT6HZY8_9GAMM|nr:hypothetical protein [Salinicola acroporae]
MPRHVDGADWHRDRKMLMILGGLPGVGKTSVARRVAESLGAIHLRIDTIEQAVRDANVCPDDGVGTVG